MKKVKIIELITGTLKAKIITGVISAIIIGGTITGVIYSNSVQKNSQKENLFTNEGYKEATDDEGTLNTVSEEDVASKIDTNEEKADTTDSYNKNDSNEDKSIENTSNNSGSSNNGSNPNSGGSSTPSTPAPPQPVQQQPTPTPSQPVQQQPTPAPTPQRQALDINALGSASIYGSIVPGKGELANAADTLNSNQGYVGQYSYKFGEWLTMVSVEQLSADTLKNTIINKTIDKGFYVKDVNVSSVSFDRSNKNSGDIINLLNSNGLMNFQVSGDKFQYVTISQDKNSNNAYAYRIVVSLGK